MNCIVIDDEPIARTGMIRLIEKTPGLHFIGDFSNVTDAYKTLQTTDIDLIFLDIQMPGMNGLEFAKNLPKHALIIFTTAYAQYALQSYEVDAIDYLLKPIKEDRFMKAVAKASQLHSLLSEASLNQPYSTIENNNLFVRANRRLHKIPYRDILYFEGMKDYVIINLAGERIITAMNLKTIQSKLPAAIFKRISKSYLVNVNYVTSIANHAVFLNDMELPLGLIYRNEFISEYLKEK